MTHGIRVVSKDILLVCETVELACSELYRLYAELFKRDLKSCSFWLRIATEMQNHAKLFALVVRLRRNDAVEEALPNESVKAEATVLRAQVQSLIEDGKIHPPTIEEALQSSIDLEAELNRFLKQNVTNSPGQYHHQEMLADSGSNPGHPDSLREAYSVMPFSGRG